MLKANPKKKKVESLSTINRRLDILVSRIVRIRDRECVTCGKPVEFNEKGLPISLTCSHWRGRKHLASRWCLKNCNTQCSEENSRHDWDTSVYDAWMLEQYGAEECARIEDASRQVKTMKRSERLALEVNLREALAKLEALNE